LKKGESSIVDEFDDVTVLFADLVKFTKLTREVESRKLVMILNEIFTRFEQVMLLAIDFI